MALRKVPFYSKSMFYEDEIVQGNYDAGEDGVTIMTRWLEAWQSVKSVTQLSPGQSATNAMLYLFWAMSWRHTSTMTTWHRAWQSVKCHPVYRLSPGQSVPNAMRFCTKPRSNTHVEYGNTINSKCDTPLYVTAVWTPNSWQSAWCFIYEKRHHAVIHVPTNITEVKMVFF